MKKEKQSWTDYVPHSVSLYYVDYRENLDSHDDLQEQCIRRNSLGPLEEQILEWYAVLHIKRTKHHYDGCNSKHQEYISILTFHFVMYL